MAEQTVVWTVLPNGISGPSTNRRLQLSVFVSPRLTADEDEDVLEAFPDLLSWPDRLAAGAVAFTVRVHSSPTGPPENEVLAAVVGRRPDPDVWTALFSAGTPVSSHTPDRAGNVLNTYSTAAVHQQLKQLHQAHALRSPVAAATLAQVQPPEQGLAQQLGNVPAMLLQAFSPMDGGQALVADQPLGLIGEGLAELRSAHLQLAADLFRPDGITGLTERLAVAGLRARRIAEEAPDQLVEVIPRSEGAQPGVEELARVVAFTRGPTSPTASEAPAPPAGPGLVAGPEEPAPPPPPPPPPDFHQSLTFLGDHPSVMRSLGLVIDLEIPLSSLPLSRRSDPAPKLLQVVPTFTEPLAGTSVSPLTAYWLEGNVFTASSDPAAGEITAGILDLESGGQYELVQVDVQDAVLKLVGSLASSPPDPAAPDATTGAPTMRSSGISVVRAEHGRRVWDRMSTAMANNDRLSAASQDMAAAQLPVLFAEDLVRGHRFDVRESEGPWRSLHQRIGTYVFREHPGGPLTVTVHDEGAVQQTATQAPTVSGALAPETELFIHESLVNWRGWSLSAPRPGRTITEIGPDTIVNSAPPGLPQLDVSFRAEPGSLPRLRFGRQYRLRCRTVDLAGNGLDLPAATKAMKDFFPSNDPVLPVGDAPGADDNFFTYCRFEPVAAPVLVPRERFTEGESTDRLVIRSRPGRSAEAEAADLTTAAAGTRTYSATSERHVVPPKGSQHLAESHGLFDAAVGSQGDTRATYHLARKEKGQLTDTAVIDVSTGQPVPLDDPSAVEVVPATDSGVTGYVVHHERQLVLPYLPDPCARGAMWGGLPGVPPPGQDDRFLGLLDEQGTLTLGSAALPADAVAQLGGSIVQLPFGAPDEVDRWPDRPPFRIVLAERTGAVAKRPEWDPANRVLTVFLAPAEQRVVRLSSYLADTDLDLLGQWQWLAEVAPEQAVDPVTRDVAVRGGRWQLTPARNVTLVHAVEQPLLVPDFTRLEAPRLRDLTSCFVGADLRVHGESTGNVDVFASWEEAVDPPGSAPLPRSAHVFDIPVHLPGDGEDAGQEDVGTVPVATYDAAAHRLTLNAPPPDDESGRTFLAQHEFGDTRHRTVRYRAVASTRFLEFFPPDVVQDSSRVTLTGAEQEVVVPSSAPPSAPGIVSVLPSFGWTRAVTAEGVRTSTRTGAVRVHLQRPWFSSGAGEQLAVVLSDSVVLPPDAALSPYVTQWGRDPIWPHHEALAPPRSFSFSSSTRSETGLPLEQLPGFTVTAVAHDVTYDKARDVICCDITLDPFPEAYFSFVRLALARYQPDALPACKLSQVVLADFVQVPPERTVTVSPDPTQPGRFAVEVRGFSPIRSFVALVRVAVEERIAGIPDPDLGWAPVAEDDPGVTVSRDVVNQPPVLWSGSVTVPADSPGRHRLVIREQEPILTDETVGGANPDGRVVFVETVVL